MPRSRSTSPARAARTPVPVPLGRRILLEKKIVAAAGAPKGGALALVPTIEAVLYGSLVTDGVLPGTVRLWPRKFVRATVVL